MGRRKTKTRSVTSDPPDFISLTSRKPPSGSIQARRDADVHESNQSRAMFPKRSSHHFEGANGTGCYNTRCPGFVQVSKTDHISGPLPEGPEGKRNIGSTIQQDKKSGNWWVTDIRYKEDDIPIGYWPKELFDVIGNGVNTLGVGGVVKTSPSGNSPPMGKGHRPTEEDKDDMVSARVLDILVMDSSLKFKLVDRSKLENLLDSDKCYGLIKGNKNLFTFGGEGGDSC
ncbi:unnamed protein product [Arabidopsis halleri]